MRSSYGGDDADELVIRRCECRECPSAVYALRRWYCLLQYSPKALRDLHGGEARRCSKVIVVYGFVADWLTSWLAWQSAARAGECRKWSRVAWKWLAGVACSGWQSTRRQRK